MASLDELFATAPPPPPPKTVLQRLLDRLSSVAPDLPTFETLTQDYLRSVHLAVFYLFGRYYHLSKRGAGIRFVRCPWSLGRDGSGNQPDRCR